jgi:hypothetical protein
MFGGVHCDECVDRFSDLHSLTAAHIEAEFFRQIEAITSPEARAGNSSQREVSQCFG